MLTTLSSLKSRLHLADADVQDDAFLSSLLALVSARFERECNRSFGYLQNATDDFPGDELELRVSRYPIDESVPITFQLLTSAAAGWQPVPDADYLPRAGCIISLPSPIGSARDQLRVIYAGGYRLPDSGGSPAPAGSGVPLPDDLQFCAVEQVAYWYQNRDRLGLVSVSAQGGSFRHVGALDLLPSVEATLRQYERWVI